MDGVYRFGDAYIDYICGTFKPIFSSFVNNPMLDGTSQQEIKEAQDHKQEMLRRVSSFMIE